MTEQPTRAMELTRLESGRCTDPPPPGMSRFEIHAHAPATARTVLSRTKQVLASVIGAADDPWPDVERWAAVLPEWFVRASAPERTADEARAWLEYTRTLSQERRTADRQTRSWSIGNFTHWFRLDERVWWWWGSEIIDDDSFRICLVVTEPNFPHEALDWLLRAAGATLVVDEYVRDLMQRKGQLRS
jgi:hypothetical protein